MNDHTLIEELTAVRVLGGLDDADFRLLGEELDAHGPACEECRVIEESFSEVAGRLAFSLDSMPLTEDAGGRIMSSVLGEAADVSEDVKAAVLQVDEDTFAEERPATGRGRGGRPRAWMRVVAAGVAAALLLAGGIGLGYLTIPRGESAQQAVARCVSGATVTRFSAENGGQLAYTSKSGSTDVCVVGSGVRPPPPGKVYQLWTISGKTPSPGPTFVPQDGTVLVTLRANLAGSQLMAVTIEPSGGSLQPTSDPVFTAPIEA